MLGISESVNIVNAASAHDIGHLDTIVKTIRYGMYQDNIVPTIISTINKQLSVAHTRDKGFEILHQILPDCPLKVLQDNCLTWTNFAISHHPKDPVPARRFQVLVGIIELCHTFQDFHKAVVTNLLSKIIESCLLVHKKSKEVWFALDCLIKCLQHFPSTCIVHKKKIETFVLAFLDLSVTNSVVEQGATCFHYLNQAGGSGSLGSTHIKNYNDSLEKLYNTLDKLYDNLFESMDEYCEYNNEYTNIFEFKEIPPAVTETEKLRILERRLRNVTAFIVKTMECSYPVKKSLKPEMLLSIINRGLAAHIHIDENGLNNILLSTIIQNHQIDLLYLLKTCITCEYKVITYQILEYWIINSSEFLDNATYDKIIRHIIADISPIKNSLILNVTTNKKAAIEQSNPDSNLPIRLKQVNEDICCQALITLQVLLKNVLLTIKDNSCTVLFETIIKNLFDISVNIHQSPYTSKNNRLMLYKVLIAIFDQQRKSLDIGLAINLLNIGQVGFDVDISDVCSEGLAALEKICQPTHLSLSLNIMDVEESNTKSVVYKPIILDSNLDEIEVIKDNENMCVEKIVDEEKNKSEIKITVNNPIKDIANDSIKEHNSSKVFEETLANHNIIEIYDESNVSNSIMDISETNLEQTTIIDETANLSRSVVEREDSCEEMDNLQLETPSASEGDKSIDLDDVPNKKLKYSEVDEIDVVGDDVDEDMESSFVDEIKE